MNLCPPGCLCLVHCLCIVWWKPWHPCMAVCLCPSPLIPVATPCLECVHASVHEFMSTLHPMSGPPLWLVTWKVGCPCVSLHVCPIHPGCGPTPCLECVHASVHEFMSTWLLMSGPLPMHSLMETLTSLYGSVFVSQSPHFCCHTLFRMCTCISTWIYVYLTPHVWSTPMISYMESWVPLCVTACVSHSPWLWSHTLFRMCTWISTWIYVYLKPQV